MDSNRVVIKATGLVKKYQNLVAVAGIDFEIFAGECFGFLGPNGAGKTTLIRLIHCFLPISSGSLQVLGLTVGKDDRQIKARIGVCPQEINLDPDFSVEKNLRVYARYFNLDQKRIRERLEELIQFAALAERRHDKVDALSGGMKRRLLLARSLINNPQLLILDEPTTGLDPQARHMIWDRIEELKRTGVTIILTTHYMEEAATLCDRVLIIDQGAIIEIGEPATLVAQHVGKETLEIWEISDQQRSFLETCDCHFDFFGRRALFSGQDTHDIVDYLHESKLPFTKMVIRPSNLEDVFLRLTGRALRE